MNLPQCFLCCEFQLFSVFGLTFFFSSSRVHGGRDLSCPVKLCCIYGWADHVYVCWIVSEMAAWVLNDVSLTPPTFSDLQFNPAFLPCPLQDIYELKDQIQDVEGRYMQGLKELKVEGLELAACLLVFSGSSLASLTLLFLLTLHPPHHRPHKALYLCAPLCMIFSSLHVLIQLTGYGLKRRHFHTSAGCRFVRRRFNMLHLLTDNMLLILRLCFQAEFSVHVRQLPVLF